MSEHTAGPWEIVKTGDNPPSWNIWAEAIQDEDATLCHDLYSEADARLIAAAPALLAALELLVEHMTEDNPEFGACADCLARVQIAQAMIAQAKGRAAVMDTTADRADRIPEPRGTFPTPRRCPHCAVLVASLAEYRAHFRAAHWRKP